MIDCSIENIERSRGEHSFLALSLFDVFSWEDAAEDFIAKHFLSLCNFLGSQKLTHRHDSLSVGANSQNA